MALDHAAVQELTEVLLPLETARALPKINQ